MNLHVNLGGKGTKSQGGPGRDPRGLAYMSIDGAQVRVWTRAALHLCGVKCRDNRQGPSLGCRQGKWLDSENTAWLCGREY